MSKITEPMANTDSGKTTKILTDKSISKITIDGIVFYDQRDADFYNQMTPEQKKTYREQRKKNEVDIALRKEAKEKEDFVNTVKITAKILAVPLGLSYFAYHQKYSLAKGIGVVVVGCGVAYFGVIAYAFRGNPFSNKGKSVKVAK
jgi:hypothetical protein